MNKRIQIINPLEYKNWDELVRSHEHCSFFHTSNWAKVLHESYRYTPLYFSIISGGRLLALVPLMEVNSRITGRRAVSLPFTDYCETVVTEDVLFEEMMDSLVEYGKTARWKSIELRTGAPLPSGYSASLTFVGHMIDLTRSEEEIYLQLRDATRRNIQKASKEGVKVSVGGSPGSLREFYRLNCMTRRDHGLPPQPYHFFEKIHEHVLAKNLGTVVLAGIDGTTIAGAVYFHFGDKVFYKYGASDRRFQHRRANNLIMWEAIRWYREQGCRSFSFGRTETENTGLLQFKAGWGARTYPIHYYKYEMRQSSFVKDKLKLVGVHNKIFKAMPIPLLRIAGSLLYRHIG